MGEKSEYALHRETHVVSTWEKVLSLISDQNTNVNNNMGCLCPPIRMVTIKKSNDRKY